MKLPVPFIQLPLAFDAGALAAEIAPVDESCWRPHPQAFPGNSMLPLVAVDGDPANEAFAGPMRATPYLEACPYLMQVIDSLGVTAGRSRLMRLSGHAEVTRHVDQGYYWAERVRVHVPIVTQPTVQFECDDAMVNMAAGECWLFDTWRPHRVLNDAVESRIHLVVDTVGGSRFWDLVAQGRMHGAPSPENWQPRMVRLQPGVVPTLALERVNVPGVMTPWELNAQLGLLFNDVVPHPELQRVQQIASRFVRNWRGLWAQYGESEQGKPHFRAEFDKFLADARLPGPPIVLRNGVNWHNALTTRVSLAAVGDETPQRGNGEYGMSDRA